MRFRQAVVGVGMMVMGAGCSSQMDVDPTTGAGPLPEGAPIGGSTEGSKSVVQ